MADNLDRDMKLSLDEAIAVINQISVPNKFEISPNHEKTQAFILDNGLITTDILEIVKSLCKDDYIKGPIPDDKPSLNRNKPVWIFKKEWDDMYLYIKVKIFLSNKKVYVVSIHEDEN